jgi:hypothetical protein
VYKINRRGPRTELWGTIQKLINRRLRILNLDIERPRLR